MAVLAESATVLAKAAYRDGYAAAADHNGHVTTEYMVSLRIL